ncbi:MAG: hypothetical protein ABWY02_16170 [Telluria sp.]
MSTRYSRAVLLLQAVFAAEKFPKIRHQTNQESSIDTSKQLLLSDIDVGLKLVDALARQASTRGGAPIAWADLLTLTRLLHPKDAAVDRAVPVGLGRKLRFVEDFCRANGFPNLACLAVNPATMRPGKSYEGDWEADVRAVAAFDWPAAGIEARLAAFAAEARGAVPKRFKPRKERPADVTWYAWFCAHREACKEVGGDDKKEIINLLMSGLDPENALRRVLAAKAEYGGAA